MRITEKIIHYYTAVKCFQEIISLIDNTSKHFFLGKKKKLHKKSLPAWIIETEGNVL